MSNRSNTVKLDKQAVSAKRRKAPEAFIAYRSKQGLGDFVGRITRASTSTLIETERRGVERAILKDLSKALGLPKSRVLSMIGAKGTIPPRKLISGSAAYTAIGLARLLGLVESLVRESNAPEAKDFETARWLGTWLESPVPALAGHSPASLLSTPTGMELVTRLIKAMASGAYQ